MPRVHKRTARKDYPEDGIRQGQVYYSWKFRRSGVRRSLTPPLPEQLTQSGFQQEWIPLNREIGAFDGTADDLKELAERARALGEEQSDKRENMPDGLQDAGAGELLGERADECEDLADELDDLASQLEEAKGETAAQIIAQVQQAAR